MVWNVSISKPSVIMALTATGSAPDCSAARTDLATFGADMCIVGIFFPKNIDSENTSPMCTWCMITSVSEGSSNTSCRVERERTRVSILGVVRPAANPGGQPVQCRREGAGHETLASFVTPSETSALYHARFVGANTVNGPADWNKPLSPTATIASAKNPN